MLKNFRFAVQNCRLPNLRPQPTVSSKHDNLFNKCVFRLFKERRYAEALDEFDFQQSRTSLRLRLSSYFYLIRACSSLRSLELGRRVHDHLLASNCEPDVILRNSIVFMYGKCGSLEDARKVFDEMPHRNVFSWTAMIDGYAQNDRFGDAIKSYSEMLQSCVVPDHVTFASTLKACSGFGDVGLGRQMHAHVLKSEFGSHHIVLRALISMYTMLDQIEYAKKVFSCIGTEDLISWRSTVSVFCKCGFLKDARKVFDKLPHRDVASWNELIPAYVQSGCVGYAIKLYLKMLRSGVLPNHITFASILKACSGTGDVGLGRQMHALVLKSEFGTHQNLQNALISMYTKLDQIEDARDVFLRMRTKDLISWKTINFGFSKIGYELEALYLFREMIGEGVCKPDGIIFGSAFNACGSLQMPEYGGQIHGLCIKFGFGRDAFARHSIFHMYAKCGFLDPARIVFSQIENPDLATCNAMIAGFANNGNSHEAVSLFSKMMQSGPIPDGVTVNSLLSACRSPSRLHQGMLVHSYIIKLGFNARVSVCNALITMYSISNSFYDAYKVFNEISDHANLVSWNSILTACMVHNHVWEIFRLFKLMFLSQIKPDRITLTTVLGASANLASLEMISHVHCYAIKTGLLWDVSVMNGLIDMYTKSGSPGSARTLFDSMRNPDIVSWQRLIKPNGCSHVGLEEEGQNLYKIMETQHGFVPTKERCICVVDMLARSGYLQEAEAFINQRAFDADIVVWETLLAACRTHKNLEIGERAAEKIMKINPSYSGALVTLSHIYACFGRWEDTAKLKKMMKQQRVDN